MRLGQFLIFTAIGANWELVVGWLDQYQLAMMTLNAGLILSFLAFRVRSYRKNRAGRSETDR